MTFEQRVQAELAKGQRPMVALLAGMEVLAPLYKRSGRRKIAKRRFDRSHYAGRRGTGRSEPYCLARRCRRKLRVNQLGFCSDDCKDKGINFALDLLRRAGVTLEELQVLYGPSAPV
jgi:hypothetical protein